MNLSHFGKKAELVARLHDAIAGEKQPVTRPSSTSPPLQPNSHTPSGSTSTSASQTPTTSHVPMQHIGYHIPGMHRTVQVPIQLAQRYQMYTQSIPPLVTPGSFQFPIGTGMQSVRPDAQKQGEVPSSQASGAKPSSEAPVNVNTTQQPEKVAMQIPAETTTRVPEPAHPDTLASRAQEQRREQSVTSSVEDVTRRGEKNNGYTKEVKLIAISLPADDIKPYPSETGDPSKPPDQQPSENPLCPTVDTFEINMSGMTTTTGKEEKQVELEEPLTDRKRKLDTEVSLLQHPPKRLFSDEIASTSSSKVVQDRR